MNLFSGAHTPEQILPSDEECIKYARLNRLLRSGSSPEAEFSARWNKDGGDYCVYCLAESGQRIRYIGISNQRIDKRLAQHLADRDRDKNVYKDNWLRSCAERNIEVTIHVVRAGLTGKQAGMIEELLIRLLKGPFRLTNTHAGGSTGYAGLSEESRAKHRVNTQKGRMRAMEEELDAIDLERGYCLLDDRELINGHTQSPKPRTTLYARPMSFSKPDTRSPESSSDLPQPNHPSWEASMVNASRRTGLSWRTEETYRNWARRFEAFLAPRPMNDVGKGDVEAFLNSLADIKQCAPSSQKQAMTALFFLIQDVMHVDLGEIEFRNAGKRPKQTLAGLTSEDCGQLFAALDGQSRLMAELMYGAGLRLSELLGLRVHHLSIEQRQLRIPEKHSGKIERLASLPTILLPSLELHLARLASLWAADQQQVSFGGVWLPARILARDPKAGLRWGWQWIFPARNTSFDATRAVSLRHHVGESRFQQVLSSATARTPHAAHASPTALRRSFAEHLLERGVGIRTVLDLLRTNKIEATSKRPDTVMS